MSAHSPSSAATSPGAVEAPTSTERKEQPLDEQTLRERLTLGSPDLVKELYEIAQRQVAFETGRQTRLDAKATSLLTAAGLALTVAFTFGGQVLLNHPDAFRTAHRCTVIAFAVGVPCGLAAAIFAVAALLVRGSYRAVNEHTVFDPALLKDADAENEDFPLAGITEYRKALTPHLWMISQAHLRNHERKGWLIKIGQLFFLAFLISLVIVCMSVVASVS
jgi:hypothetical protein